jgi:Fe-S-cluster-containing dehydrogenase component
MKAFVINTSRCSGCYACQLACKDEHCGNDWMPYAKPQPEWGQFWMKIHELERGTVPKVKIAFIPVLCQHCKDAPCIPACPVSAIIRRSDGLVFIDPKKCTGCQSCLNADACPYGVIFYNEQLHLAQKCTGCAHLLDRGWPIKEPRCADACHMEAIKFGEEAELSSLISTAEVFHPEFGTSPGVYYIGLPKRFIAGTVYDPSIKEIIKDATCSLNGEGVSLTAKTDGFGDFWFEGLKVGTFSVKIEAAGKTWTKDNISTESDINLGDIALS